MGGRWACLGETGLVAAWGGEGARAEAGKAVGWRHTARAEAVGPAHRRAFDAEPSRKDRMSASAVELARAWEISKGARGGGGNKRLTGVKYS